MAQLPPAAGSLASAVPEAAAESSAPRRVRLESVDALRALAAIAVVLVHSFEVFGLGLPDLADSSGRLTDAPAHQLIVALYEWIFRLGGLAVPVFIALSGYSLMIPVARAAQHRWGAGQLGTFFIRRARRIVPPYYAAMLLSLLLIVAVPGLGVMRGVYWDRALRNLDGANVASHLVLAHNLDPRWIDGINPPFWSLAVEWQIYFLFPLLVVLWRRFSLVALIGVAAVYGIAPLYLPITLLPFTHSHFVLLFALGMAGAAVAFSARPIEARLRERLPWALLAGLGALAFAAMHVGRQGLGLPLPDGWLPELVVGGATIALLVHCTRSQLEGRDSRAERALSHPALTRIGIFSYSLYLVHLPILALLGLLATSLGLPVTASYLLIFAAGLPLSLVVAYGFHLIFERPFLNSAPARKLAPATT